MNAGAEGKPRSSTRRGPPPWTAIEFARAGETLLIRVIGLWNMEAAVLVDAFCRDVLGDGSVRFAFDLSECRSMDSTFIGTLVGLACSVRDDQDGDSCAGWICMLNARDHHTNLLGMMGADRFLRFKNCDPLGQIEWHAMPRASISRDARTRRIRTAHEALVAIDERNQERFGPFLRTLEAELDE